MIKIASQQQMKQINAKTIFRLIQREKGISRAALAKVTSLSPTTISTIVEDLMAKGLVIEKSLIKGAGAGRRAITLETNGTSKYIIGMEFDHQGVSGTVYNLKYEPIITATEHFHNISRINEEIPKLAIQIISQLIEQAQSGFDELIAICVGVPGLLDEGKKTIVFSTHLNIVNIDLYDKLAQKFNYPIFIENETLLSAIAEREIMQRKTSPFIYVALNDGLGISVIINDRYLEGVNGVFLEIGHMSLDVNGEQCSCGNRGCFELHVSTSALLKKVKQHTIDYTDSLLARTPADNNPVDAQQIAQALNNGDPLAKLAVKEYGTDLGNGLVNLIHIFNPEAIVLGGKLSILGDELVQHAQQQVDSRAMSSFLKRCTISLALYKGNQISLEGARISLNGTQISTGGAIFALSKVVEAY
jgi:N-acetylglucosamine repressor